MRGHFAHARSLGMGSWYPRLAFNVVGFSVRRDHSVDHAKAHDTGIVSWRPAFPICGAENACAAGKAAEPESGSCATSLRCATGRPLAELSSLSRSFLSITEAGKCGRPDPRRGCRSSAGASAADVAQCPLSGAAALPSCRCIIKLTGYQISSTLKVGPPITEMGKCARPA